MEKCTQLIKPKNCSDCNKEGNISQFINLTNGRETKTCLTCRLKSINSNTVRKELPKIIEQYKDKCEICEDDNLSHIQFDHIDPKMKYKNITSLSNIDDLYEELNKVRTLCGKCHAKQTRIQQDEINIEINRNIDKTNKTMMYMLARKERNRKYVNDIKIKIGKCQEKGCTDIFDSTILSFYEFDHIDYNTKCKEISEMARSTYSIQRLQEEIDKCVLNCQYCHRLKTNIQNKEKIEEFKNLLEPKPNKEKIIIVKLNFEMASQLRIDYSSKNYTVKDLVKKYNISNTNVYRVLKNIIWKDKNYNSILPDKLKINLSLETKQEIYDKYNSGDTYSDLALHYDINEGTVRKYSNYRVKYNGDIDNSQIPKKKIKRVTKDIVKSIRDEYLTGKFTCKNLVDKYEISKSCISSIVNNKTHKDESYTPPKKK